MNTLVSLETVRGRLALIWFGGWAGGFVMLVGQSVGGVFGDPLEKTWAWAIPNIAPTLSLMISVFAAYAVIPSDEVDRMQVRTTFFKLAFGLSIFYLINVVVVIVAAPFTSDTAGAGTLRPVDVLHTSNFWLGPL